MDGLLKLRVTFRINIDRTSQNNIVEKEHLIYYSRKFYFTIKAEKESNVMGIDEEWKDFLNAFEEFRQEKEIHGRAQNMNKTQNQKDNILGIGKTTLECLIVV